MRDLRAVNAHVRDYLRNHHGVISRKQALTLGLSDAMILRKVRRGEWETVHRSVYRDAGAPKTDHQTLRAACLAVGSHAVASHRSAAWLWGLVDRAPATPEITVARPLQHGRHVSGVVLHQSCDLDEGGISERHGIRTTNPLRTLVDMGASVTAKELADALDRGIARKLVTIVGVVAEVDRLGRRGRPGPGAIRRLLKQRGFIGVPHPSVLESKTQRIFLTYKLPLPDCELVTGKDGEYRLDFAYPALKLAIEVDGYVWHFSPEHTRRDHKRRNALTLQGWQILVYTWREITQEPARVAREIAEAYRKAKAQLA